MEPLRRVRFAPSPTGPLHVGGLRTALFNYLFTKKVGGEFILRIEDTDKKREVSGAEKYILDSLRWCGIIPDKGPGDSGGLGPYRQSERNNFYQEKIQTLVDLGCAYYAFDSESELSEYRTEHEKKGETFIYNWKNRLSLKNSLSLGKEATYELLKKRQKYVIRFLVPKNKTITTTDIIRGESSIDSKTLDDKILMKADGTPTYHFANVVDDHLMKITHVIRGEEWLPSLALHVLLYEAFGWSKPFFAHLPLILNPNGKGKLSKRSGEKSGFPVFPIEWSGKETFEGFKERGILAGGLVNYLATLGWTPKEGSEILSLEQLVELFCLEDVVSSGANFDLEKLKWYNHKHIQEAEESDLIDAIISVDNSLEKIDKKRLNKAVIMVRERANTTSELWGLMRYLFNDPEAYDDKGVKRVSKDGLNKILSQIKLQSRRKENVSVFVDDLKSWGQQNGFAVGQIMMTFRMVLVGELSGVDLQDIISFIGLESVERRAENFRRTI